jgi:putative DNA primase/helicase
MGTIARRLGGQISGGDTILCPGPGHSVRDRSLAVKLDPNAPDGFLTYSHAGDDWRECRNHVRERLGLPRWEPGDEQQRRVPAHHVDKWDLAAIETEADAGPRAWTDDEVLRIAAARRIWEEALVVAVPRANRPGRMRFECKRLGQGKSLAAEMSVR